MGRHSRGGSHSTCWHFNKHLLQCLLSKARQVAWGRGPRPLAAWLIVGGLGRGNIGFLETICSGTMWPGKEINLVPKGLAAPHGCHCQLSASRFLLFRFRPHRLGAPGLCAQRSLLVGSETILRCRISNCCSMALLLLSSLLPPTSLWCIQEVKLS